MFWSIYVNSLDNLNEYNFYKNAEFKILIIKLRKKRKWKIKMKNKNEK